jgi:cell wall-associated NlpC family hydrolase
VAQNLAGRHRVPGRYNPLAELKTIAKESAQPAVKGAAIVAASGGLVATFAHPASADDAAAVAAAGVKTSNAAVLGPQSASLKTTTALNTIGFAASGAAKAADKPVVITDVVVAKERAEQAAKAAAERAEARASRSRTFSNPVQTASGLVGIAQSAFGVPYAYGGESMNGFDCSGLTQWVYRQAGISIPRTASAQQSAATRVSSPQPGDLVFFGYPAYHVGIYVKPGVMIDAPYSGKTVGYHSIWTTPSGYGRF